MVRYKQSDVRVFRYSSSGSLDQWDSFCLKGVRQHEVNNILSCGMKKYNDNIRHDENY